MPNKHFFYHSLGTWLHWFNHVYLLLWQKCPHVERLGVKHCYHWCGLFNFCSNFNHYPGDFKKPSNEKEQRVLSYHNESLSDAFSVQLTLYHRCPIDQECHSLWDYSFTVALFVSHNSSLVFRVHIYHLWPNYQRISEIEDEIYSADGLRWTSNLCDGEFCFIEVFTMMFSNCIFSVFLRGLIQQSWISEILLHVDT